MPAANSQTSDFDGESHYMQVYRKDDLLPPATLYEKICLSIPKDMLIPGLPDMGFREILRDASLVIEPQHIFSLAAYVFLVMLTIGVYVVMFLPEGGGTLNAVAVGLPFFAAGVVVSYPFLRKKIVRMQIVGQSPLAILYLVISLRVAPSLERAVAYAAEHVPDPMGREFKFLLWDVEMRTHLDMHQAITDYSKKIKPWAPGYSDALYLVADSANEPTEALRTRSLEKAIATALDFTRSVMERYARGLGVPVSAINALGILLPVMGLVLAPMVAMFMTKGGSTAIGLVVIYDVVLPILMMSIIYSLLSVRPGTFSVINVDDYPGLSKWGHMTMKTDTGQTEVPLVAVSLAAAVILGSITIFSLMTNGIDILLPTPRPGIGPAGSFATLFGTLGFGVGLGLYFYLDAKERLEIRGRIKEMEREFTSSLFQLGNIMNQGTPIEQAFEETAKDMAGTKSADFFNSTVYNIRAMGMPIESAIFDEKCGAIIKYPSSMIRNVMNVVLKSSQEGPEVAAATAASISNYLGNLQKVEEKVEDTLSDSVSSMRFQAMFLIPLVSGVVVGLNQLMSSILLQISRQINDIFQGSAMEMYSGSFIKQIMNIQGVIQASYMQVVVGFYTVVLLAIIGYFIGGLEHGTDDKIGIYLNVGQVLLSGTVIYVVVTATVSLVFGSLGSVLSMGG